MSQSLTKRDHLYYRSLSVIIDNCVCFIGRSSKIHSEFNSNTDSFFFNNRTAQLLKLHLETVLYSIKQHLIVLYFVYLFILFFYTKINMILIIIYSATKTVSSHDNNSDIEYAI